MFSLFFPLALFEVSADVKTLKMIIGEQYYKCLGFSLQDNIRTIVKSSHRHVTVNITMPN